MRFPPVKRARHALYCSCFRLIFQFAPVESNPLAPDGNPEREYWFMNRRTGSVIGVWLLGFTSLTVDNPFVLGSSEACDSPPAGLVAWYTGDGTPLDFAFNSDFESFGDLRYAPGKVSQAFRFDGVSAHAKARRTPALDVGSKDGLTIEFWINPDEVSLLPQPLVEWNNGMGGAGVHLWMNLSSLGWTQGSLFANLIDVEGNDHIISAAGPVLVADRWQHVALTYDPVRGSASLYCDGQEIITREMGSFVPRTDHDLFLAARISGNPISFFQGRLDEVGIYNRALTPAEIRTRAVIPDHPCRLFEAPQIMSVPRDATVVSGDEAVFTVQAVGSPPLRYQWLRDGQIIHGAVHSNLVLPGVQISDAGRYAVLISNETGSVTSPHVILTLYEPSCLPSPTGLVAWWSGSGTAADLAMNHDLIFRGGLDYRPGKVGQAFAFTAGPSYALAKGSSALDVGASEGLTIEFWMNPDPQVSAQPLQPLFEWSNGMRQVGAHVWFSHSGSAPGELFANLVDTEGRAHWLRSDPGVIQTNRFQHVALTFDKVAGKGRLYCNGSQIAEGNLGVFTPDTRNDLFVGARIHNDGNVFYQGAIDDVGIYRRALTSREIEALYLANAAGKCDLPLAPRIVTQPQAQIAVERTLVQFTVVAVGEAPLHYQWLLDGTELPGANRPDLALTNLSSASAGSYSVVVHNSLGTATSLGANLTVTPGGCRPHGFVALWSAEGDARDMVGSHHGLPLGGLTYATGKNGQGFSFDGNDASIGIPAAPELDLGAGDGLTVECWVKPVNPARLQPLVEWGDGSALIGPHLWLALPVENGGQGAGSFFANIVDKDGEVHFITSPHGLVRSDRFQHLALTYEKLSGQAALYLDGTMVETVQLGRFVPRTSLNLHFGKRASIGRNDYFLGVMDEIGLYRRALSPEEVYRSFLARDTAQCVLPPVIERPPATQTVVQGRSANFLVQAGGAPPLVYQWLFNGVEIPGANGSRLSVPDVPEGFQGSYAVRVSNPFGSVVSPEAGLSGIRAACAPIGASLAGWWPAEGSGLDRAAGHDGHVNGPMGFVPGQVGQAFHFNGTNASIRISASAGLAAGSPHGLTVELWINPSDLEHPRPVVEWNDGANPGVHLWISEDDRTGDGRGSLFANLVSAGNVNHLLRSASGILRTNEYQHVALTHDQVSGIARLFWNGVIVAESTFGSLDLVTTPNLYLGERPMSNVSELKPGFFAGALDEVTVYNRALTPEEIIAAYTSDRSGKCILPPVLVSYSSNQTVTAGSDTFLAVEVSGLHPISYRWLHDQVDLPGATRPSLVFTNVQSSHAGDYHVIAVTPFGSVASPPMRLDVLPTAPIFTLHPKSQTTFAGSPMLLTAAARGSEPVSYQWLFDGIPIEGANGPRLQRDQSSLADTGSYSVLARNAHGMTTSAVARVTLTAPVSDALDWPRIRFVPVGAGHPRITAITHAGDGSERLFLGLQGGSIQIRRGGILLPTPFLDISTRVLTPLPINTEQGLLGLAFSPQYAGSGYFYVNYTRRPDGATVVSRFAVTADPDRADPGSERVLLVIPQRSPLHNGGHLAFGPDGYLYIGSGDGGPQGDPNNEAQTTSSLLGKLLRVDVQTDPDNYRIPRDNPFVLDPAYRPEIWAWGLRNPWRFSFDRQTGDLYIADVGQNLWEEVNFQPASSPGGQNYGWRLKEGNNDYSLPPGFNTGGLTAPIIEYHHTLTINGHSNGSSVIGGYVSRSLGGGRMNGQYYYGDYVSRWVWASAGSGSARRSLAVGRLSTPITTFGEDEAGRLHVGAAPNLFRLEDDRTAYPPNFFPSSGEYASEQDVIVSCLTPNATIYYTFENRDPAVGDASVIPGGRIKVAQGGTLRARAFRPDLLPSLTTFAFYRFQVDRPLFHPPAGSAPLGSVVTLSTGTPGAVIHYSTDGSEPSPSSAAYTGPIVITNDVTITAQAFRDGFVPSPTVRAAYVLPQVAAPLFDPPSQVFSAALTVELRSATAEAGIRFTLDGSEPGPGSPLYREPLTLTSDSIVKAQAFKLGFLDSPVRAAFYNRLVVSDADVQTVTGPLPDGTWLRRPEGLVVAADGTILIADTGHGRIIAWPRDGKPRKIVAPIVEPHRIAIDPSGGFLVSSADRRLFGWEAGGKALTRFIGSNRQTGDHDGWENQALFNEPRGLAWDPLGRAVFVADSANHRVRKIDSAGRVSTFAGSGRMGGEDGISATASFAHPTDLCLDLAGNLWIADTDNHAIRRVSPEGGVSTYAGAGMAGYLGGRGAHVQFNAPQGIAVDRLGNLYVADTGNHLIRKIRPDGTVIALAGGLTPGHADGPAAAALFRTPHGVAVDQRGVVYVADTGNNAVRMITPLDWDEDGIPDADETAAGPYRVGVDDRMVDSDGDGQSNAEEFIAGSNPADASSRFLILSVTLNEDASFTFTWTSSPARTYQIQFSEDAVRWSDLGPAVRGAEGVLTTMTDAVSLESRSARLYRIAVGPFLRTP